MKKFLKILAIVAATLVAVCVFVGIYMCNYALLPEEHGNEIEADRGKIDQKYPGIIAWFDDLHENGYFRDTTITGENGYKLHAVYSAAAQPETANGTAVVVHGYTDNHLCTDLVMNGRYLCFTCRNRYICILINLKNLSVHSLYHGFICAIFRFEDLNELFGTYIIG